MSFRFDTPLIDGAFVFGVSGLGVLAEDVPSTGQDGAPPLYNDLEFPDDAGAEVRALITTWPTDGDLVMAEDSSFTFSGAALGMYFFEYQAYKDGVAVGSPQRVDLNYGAPEVVLTGHATAQAGGGASLKVGAGLGAQAKGQAGGSGSLTATGAPAELAADAQAEAAASALLAGTVPPAKLEADAAAQATAEGALSTGVGLSADAKGVAHGIGTLVREDGDGTSGVRRTSLARKAVRSTAKPKRRKKTSWSPLIGEMMGNTVAPTAPAVAVSTPAERMAAIDELLANEGIDVEAAPGMAIRDTDEADLMYILQFIARM